MPLMILIFTLMGPILVRRRSCAGNVVSGSINGAATSFGLPVGGIIHLLG